MEICLLQVTVQNLQSVLFSIRFNGCKWYLVVKPWPSWTVFNWWLKRYWGTSITIWSLLPSTVNWKNGVWFPAGTATLLFLATSSRLWGTFQVPPTVYCTHSDRTMKLNARLRLALMLWMRKSILTSCRSSLFGNTKLLRYAMLWKCTARLFVSIKSSMPFSIYIYIYIYICVCVCVCVCWEHSRTNIELWILRISAYTTHSWIIVI